MIIKLSGYGDEISPDLDVQMDVLASEGISYIDLRSVGNKNVLQLTDEEITDIKKRLDARGFKISSIASPIGKTDIHDDFSLQQKDVIRAIQLAKYFGTPFIRIFSFLIPKGEDPVKNSDEVCKRMKEITHIAEQEGVTLVFKNEMESYGDNGARVREILECVNSSHLRFAFDPGNFILVQVLPITDTYPYVKNFINYIHIKDARVNTGEIVLPGEGDGELYKLISALKVKNYWTCRPQSQPVESNFGAEWVNLANCRRWRKYTALYREFAAGIPLRNRSKMANYLSGINSLL